MTKTSKHPFSTDLLGRRSFLTLCASGVLLPQIARPQASPREVEGGIGGTGIVGLVTELATLSVAGHRLKIDADTVFTDAFGAVEQRDIALGDSVTVEAISSSKGHIARRVHVTHPLVGRITDLSPSKQSFKVNGVAVRMTGKSLPYPEGTRVAVSGLWQGSGVVASLVRRTREPRDLVAGDVTRRFGGTSIGPVRVAGRNIGRASNGSFASALGRYDTVVGRFEVRSFENARFLGAAGPLAQLAIEGYLETAKEAPGFRISGLGHSFARNLNLSAFETGKTLFSGPYAGRFNARRGIPLPDGFEAQRRLLRKITL